MTEQTVEYEKDPRRGAIYISRGLGQAAWMAPGDTLRVTGEDGDVVGVLKYYGGRLARAQELIDEHHREETNRSMAFIEERVRGEIAAEQAKAALPKKIKLRKPDGTPQEGPAT